MVLLLLEQLEPWINLPIYQIAALVADFPVPQDSGSESTLVENLGLEVMMARQNYERH